MTGGLVLGRRALGRALLARQHLLERVEATAHDEIDHLVAMQAQNPRDPYTALWSRLRGSDPMDLSGLIADRRAVRMSLQRGTIHLATERDALSLRPLLDAFHRSAFEHASPFGRQLLGVDRSALIDVGRALVAEQPRTTVELGRLLGERWPDHPPTALAAAVRYLVPMVQVPPRGLWEAGGQAAWISLETWLGRSIQALGDVDAAQDALVTRYLAAFGPATPADARVWSGIRGLGPAFERLRPRLWVGHDERGRELFDLPEAPRPDPETPAPPRFLPQYDNVLLGHLDRGRIVDEDTRRSLSVLEERMIAPFLVDGEVTGAWWPARVDDRTDIVLRPRRPLTPAETDALAAEAAGLATFLARDAAPGAIRFVDPA